MKTCIIKQSSSSTNHTRERQMFIKQKTYSTKRMGNNASARSPKLTLGSRDLDLWPQIFTAIAPWTTCLNLQQIHPFSKYCVQVWSMLTLTFDLLIQKDCARKKQLHQCWPPMVSVNIIYQSRQCKTLFNKKTRISQCEKSCPAPARLAGWHYCEQVPSVALCLQQLTTTLAQ